MQMLINRLRYTPRDLAMMRLFFGLWIGGGGLIFPFFSLYLNNRGLSGTEIGLLTPLSAIAATLAAIVWGRWIDHSSRRGQLLQIGLIGVALTVIGQYWQSAFWGFATLVTIQSLFGSGIEPLATSFAMQTVEKHQLSGFGSIRRWGSFGWALLVPLGGWLNERLGLGFIFWGYAGALLGCALLASWFAEPASQQPRRQAGFFSGFIHVLGSPALLRLMVSLVLIGFLHRGVLQFQNIYLQQLGAGAGLIGVASMLGSVVELPAMVWADRAIARWGARRVLAASFVLDGVRTLAILAFPQVGTIIAMNALGGLSFSMRLVGLIAYLMKNSPEGQIASTLALFNVTLPNLIGILAAPLSGAVFDLIGAHWLYALSAAGFWLAWGSLNFPGLRKLPRKI